jgi:hypothetical protein
LLVILLFPAWAWAYRPFVSTDAAVADPKEFEIELGYFNLEHTRHDNTITTPSLVLNYGFVTNWEAVAEFSVEASPEFEVTDPGLFVKGVLKEGVLQDKPGLSIAVEAGVLLPSTLPHDRRTRGASEASACRRGKRREHPGCEAEQLGAARSHLAADLRETISRCRRSAPY